MHRHPDLLAGRPPAPSAEPPDDRVARQPAATAAKQQFSRYAIAMVGITPAYPLDATYVQQDTLDGKAVHLLDLAMSDEYVGRLYVVDTKTNLPRMISWMGTLPMGPPPERLGQAADLLRVEHRLFFSDYKKADGLNWPHRFREVVGRSTILDTRLGKFKVNPIPDP